MARRLTIGRRIKVTDAIKDFVTRNVDDTSFAELVNTTDTATVSRCYSWDSRVQLAFDYNGGIRVIYVNKDLVVPATNKPLGKRL